MLPYWILFAYFAAGAALDLGRRTAGVKPPRAYLLIGLLLMTLMIGTRFKVGGDWRAYEFMFGFVRYKGLESVLTFSDPGYQFLNWIVQQSPSVGCKRSDLAHPIASVLEVQSLDERVLSLSDAPGPNGTKELAPLPSQVLDAPGVWISYAQSGDRPALASEAPVS